MKKEFHYMSG